MSKTAVEHIFTGTTTTTYNSSLTTLGGLMCQKTGITNADKWAGPYPVSLARVQEDGTYATYPTVVQYSSTLDWIFLAEFSAAANTRRIVAYTFDKSTQSFTYRGFITGTFSAGNHTVRGLAIHRHLYTTGTASVSGGTAVTGTDTTWQTDRLAVGARIGFGSTDPTAITNWYYISAIGNDTSITLSGNGPTSSGAYVIEELRIVMSTTCSTVANGGLFVIKGVNWDDFVPAGTSVALATNTDNIKAVYWLKDTPLANTVAGGVAYDAPTNNQNHNVYVTNVDAASTLRIYKYNIRAALTVASGASTDAYLYRTGQCTVTGTINQTQSCTMATLSHGPGSGIECIYLTTTTRICRVPVASVVDGSIAFVADHMVEIPPGGVNTYAATSAMNFIIHCPFMDRLIIGTNNFSRQYVTKYYPTVQPIDLVFSSDNRQIDASTSSADLSPYPSSVMGGLVPACSNGLTYLVRHYSTAAGYNIMYAVPLGADWDFASSTGCRIITPALSTPNIDSFYKLYVNKTKLLGGNMLGIIAEPYRVYVRTEGIIDNSGDWNLVDESGDISWLNPSSSVQVMFEFRTIGTTCACSRIHSVAVVYETYTTDSHYQPSVKHTDRVNKKFAWRFATAFGGTVPTLNVKIYNAITGGLLLSDTTTAQSSGLFEKSTDDGASWGSYNTSDKANDTTYVRYTPASFADNIKIKVVLCQ